MVTFIFFFTATHNKKNIHHNIYIYITCFLYCYLWPTKLFLHLTVKQLPFIQDSVYALHCAKYLHKRKILLTYWKHSKRIQYSYVLLKRGYKSKSSVSPHGAVNSSVEEVIQSALCGSAFSDSTTGWKYSRKNYICTKHVQTFPPCHLLNNEIWWLFTWHWLVL